MHTCIHAYMHTCIHAYMHTYIRTYMHTYMQAYMTDVYIGVCINKHICLYIYIYICICMCMYMHIYIYICLHIYTHSCIHVYIYIFMFVCILHMYSERENVITQPKILSKESRLQCSLVFVPAYLRNNRRTESCVVKHIYYIRLGSC